MVSQLAQVRRFNRTVTQRVGALDDRFLSRSRPLATARLLWEIGTEGGEVVMLRSRLGVDSGQMSRMLRALEAEGLVTRRVAEQDRRAAIVRLTPAGKRHFATMARAHERWITTLLSSLSTSERKTLYALLGAVKRGFRPVRTPE